MVRQRVIRDIRGTPFNARSGRTLTNRSPRVRHCTAREKPAPRPPCPPCADGAAVQRPRGRRSCATARAGPPVLDARTVLLVVSPHPDDETLCCAGVMQRVARPAAGERGVAHERGWLAARFAHRKQLLRRSAAHALLRRAAHGRGARRHGRSGSALAGQLFLGYPDGGLLALGRGTARIPTGRISLKRAPSPTRRRCSRGIPTPATASSATSQPCSGGCSRHSSLRRAPWTPIPDHQAAGLLASEAARTLGGVVVRYWIVHGGEGWPSPRGLVPGIPLTTPPVGVALAPRPSRSLRPRRTASSRRCGTTRHRCA